MDKHALGSPREQFANGSRWTAYIGAQVCAAVDMLIKTHLERITLTCDQSQLESNPSTAGFVSFEEYMDDSNEAIKTVLGH